jgi:hypothetical protein
VKERDKEEPDKVQTDGLARLLEGAGKTIFTQANTGCL